MKEGRKEGGEGGGEVGEEDEIEEAVAAAAVPAGSAWRVHRRWTADRRGCGRSFSLWSGPRPTFLLLMDGSGCVLR